MDDSSRTNHLSFDESTDSSGPDTHEMEKEVIALNDIECKYLEEQANLKRSLDEISIKCQFMHSVMKQKDELIHLLEKEKTLLENEKISALEDKQNATKEKENAVIRFAIAEKTVLEIKSAKELCEKREKGMITEIENLCSKLKMMTNEKNKICGLLDNKLSELKNCQKELQKCKEDMCNFETKLKWNTVKLKQEIEAKQNIEKENELLKNQLLKIKHIEIPCAPLKNDKTVEQQAALILLKHSSDEKDIKIVNLESKIQIMKNDFDNIMTSLIEAKANNDVLKNQNDTKDKEIQEFQCCIDNHSIKIAELQTSQKEMESLKVQLFMEKEQLCLARIEINMNNNTLEEQQTELQEQRTRENELLQLNKELCDALAKLQNEFSITKSKMLALSIENETIKTKNDYYQAKISDVEEDLKKEKSSRNDETVLLTKHIYDKTKLLETTKKKLEVSVGDLDAVKKKHAQTLKETYRELNYLRNKTANPVLENETPTSHSSVQSSDSDSQSIQGDRAFQVFEPPIAKLINRIISLQQANTRQTEKIDFLENHSSNLVSELQKKSKLLQFYIIRNQSGTLLSASDKYKTELCQYGDVVGAIYNGIKTNTSEMTLDISLDINKKLQAIVEDILLRNITLKENLDTLGLEVDTLTRQLSKAKKVP